jgi:hypothetical protein
MALSIIFDTRSLLLSILDDIGTYIIDGECLRDSLADADVYVGIVDFL